MIPWKIFQVSQNYILSLTVQDRDAAYQISDKYFPSNVEKNYEKLILLIHQQVDFNQKYTKHCNKKSRKLILEFF
jgi:hypothetical protein